MVKSRKAAMETMLTESEVMLAHQRDIISTINKVHGSSTTFLGCTTDLKRRFEESFSAVTERHRELNEKLRDAMTKCDCLAKNRSRINSLGRDLIENVSVEIIDIYPQWSRGLADLNGEEFPQACTIERAEAERIKAAMTSCLAHLKELVKTLQDHQNCLNETLASNQSGLVVQDLGTNDEIADPFQQLLPDMESKRVIETNTISVRPSQSVQQSTEISTRPTTAQSPSASSYPVQAQMGVPVPVSAIPLQNTFNSSSFDSFLRSTSSSLANIFARHKSSVQSPTPALTALQSAAPQSAATPAQPGRAAWPQAPGPNPSQSTNLYCPQNRVIGAPLRYPGSPYSCPMPQNVSSSAVNSAHSPQPVLSNPAAPMAPPATYSYYYPSQFPYTPVSQSTPMSGSGTNPARIPVPQPTSTVLQYTPVSQSTVRLWSDF